MCPAPKFFQMELKMTSNDLIILDKTLEQRNKEVDPELKPSDFFELFIAEQILKDFDLSYEELDAGRVGGGGDGGIDALYLFANGELVQEDTDLSQLKRDVAIDLIVIQAKNQPTFTESAIDKLIAVSEELLNLSANYDALKKVYNENLLSAMILFKNTYETLAARFPKFKILYVYATKGDSPHPNVKRKIEKLNDVVKSKFTAADYDFKFLGAKELNELARRSPRSSYTLTLSENPISSAGEVGFICLVKLKEYFKFITDDQKRLMRGLFEANVRDYQGATEVNQDIQATLRQIAREEFWWLNNGITVLASRATLSGKTLTIEDPQIVNGLQTSTQIFNHFRDDNTENEDRNLLVRVIVPPGQESWDRVIKATNSQTKIPISSLRATEKIHRNIEEFLKSHGLFYDRRKNFYKNEGKPLEKIISIPEMAQSIMAIILQRPDSARARPSSLLKEDGDYTSVFNEGYPITTYLIAPQIMKRIERQLRKRELAQNIRANLRFHIGMVSACLVTKKLGHKPEEISMLRLDAFTEDIIERALEIVQFEYESLGATDQVSKSPNLVENLKMKISSILEK